MELVANETKAHTRSLAEDRKDVNQIYGCFMVPLDTTHVGRCEEPRPTAVARLLDASTGRLDASPRAVALRTRVGHALLGSVHLPHRH